MMRGVKEVASRKDRPDINKQDDIDIEAGISCLQRDVLDGLGERMARIRGSWGFLGFLLRCNRGGG